MLLSLLLCCCLCCCMQVTGKLARLCVQALQQPLEKGVTLSIACGALNAWLEKAAAPMRASPGSRAAAAVRQQLQESGLLQHLGPGMDAAAARLTAAVDKLAAALAPSSGSSGNGGSGGSNGSSKGSGGGSSSSSTRSRHPTVSSTTTEDS